jgi:hypothetical protein
MAQLNDYIGYDGTNNGKPNQPVTPQDPNGIFNITPQNERGDVKLAYAIWVAAWKEYTYGSGADPGKFDYPGLTYADE